MEPIPYIVTDPQETVVNIASRSVNITTLFWTLWLQSSAKIRYT